MLNKVAEPQKIPHQKFSDWMKAVGMLLVVVGHVIGDPMNISNQVAQPVYAKQLGVCFFIFATGWSLANDPSPRFRVVFNRLFPMYFYGVITAVLVSTVFFFYKGDTNLSNYLPFIGGVNVFMDAFPANPTTWYIGLYIHLILFWCFFLQNKPIKISHLIVAFCLENLVRCLVLSEGRIYTAYMLLPNWITIFLLGSYLRHQRDANFHPKILALIAALIVFMSLWPTVMKPLEFGREFPFRSSGFDSFWSLPLQSVIISFLYITYTLVFFTIVRHLPLPSIVAFFARNTVITFIVHMPIVFELSRYFYSLFSPESEIGKRLAWIFVLYVGLGIFSEIVQRSINLRKIRTLAWSFVLKYFPKLDSHHPSTN